MRTKVFTILLVLCCLGCTAQTVTSRYLTFCPQLMATSEVEPRFRVECKLDANKEKKHSLEFRILAYGGFANVDEHGKIAFVYDDGTKDVLPILTTYESISGIKVTSEAQTIYPLYVSTYELPEHITTLRLSSVVMQNRDGSVREIKVKKNYGGKLMKKIIEAIEEASNKLDEELTQQKIFEE